MIENKDDTLEIDFILNTIKKEDYVDEEVLLLYENLFRNLKRVLLSLHLDITLIENERNKIMKVYNQI